MLVSSRSQFKTISYVIKPANKNITAGQSMSIDRLSFNRKEITNRFQFCLANFKKQKNSQRLLHSSRYYFSYRSEENYIDFEKDYYEILGVDQKADFQQIKQKFYFLAKQYHPDKNKGHQTTFKSINQAYNILSQPKLRKQYDQNRNRIPDKTNSSGLDATQTSSRPLSYQPYSQLSRAQWAVLRNGYMNQSQVDYSNYIKTFNPEQDQQVRFKMVQQWNRNFRTLTKEQIYEEIQFRQKLQKKYRQQIRKHIQAKQQFLEQKFKKVGDLIQKILGRKVRSFYDYLIKK